MDAQLIGARIPGEITALMAALQFQGRDSQGLCNLEDREWKSLLAFSDFANLTLALAQQPNAGIPRWVEQRLQRNLEETTVRFERVRVLYREAAEALSAAGIPHLVLKGFTQAPEYVRHPRFRAQSDLDLYCPAELIPAAQDELKGLGYRPVREARYYQFADHVPTLARPSSWEWKGNIFDPEKPLTIELHFCLWNSNVSRIAIPDVGGFWDRRIIRSIDDLHFPALNSVDHLGYLALHILREVITGTWMGNHLYEVAGFLHRHAEDEEFWRMWERDHDLRLRRFETVVFSMAERWFACRIPAPARTQIELLPHVLQRWCTRFVAAPLEAKFRTNKAGRLLHFLLADSWAGKREALVRVVVPYRVARPGDSVVQSAIRSGPGNKYAGYIGFLFRRMVTKTEMILEFFVHALVVFIPSLVGPKDSESELDGTQGPVIADATKRSQ